MIFVWTGALKTKILFVAMTAIFTGVWRTVTFMILKISNYKILIKCQKLSEVGGISITISVFRIIV